jgi:hypothetical protein
MDQGIWKVLVTVEADNCSPTQFGILIPIRADGAIGQQILVRESGDFGKWLVSQGDIFRAYFSGFVVE